MIETVVKTGGLQHVKGDSADSLADCSCEEFPQPVKPLTFKDQSPSCRLPGRPALPYSLIPT